MVEYLTDKEGDIIAFIEYWICDKDSTLNDKGEYIYLNELCISKTKANKTIIPKIILMIHKRVPWCKWAWFIRRKYRERPRMYSVTKWVKLAKKSIKEEV